MESKVVMENDRVRVVDTLFKQNDKAPMHSHPDHVVYVLKARALATRTVNGKVEKVGGICSVATLPGHTRKGICTALLNRAHEHFLERGYRFSRARVGCIKLYPPKPKTG